MKAGIVGVSLEEIEKLAKSIPGITVLHQKGFVKLTGNVPNRAVYPTFTKIVSEIHLSGFSADHKQKIPGAVTNPKYPKPTKRVTHFLDQREGVVTPAQVLANLELVLKSMVSAEVVVPVKFEAPIAEKPAAEPVQEAKEPVAEVTELHSEQKQEEHLEEIVAIAASEHGEEPEGEYDDLEDFVDDENKDK